MTNARELLEGTTLGRAIIQAANDGYHNRNDYPPFALAPWDDRLRWSDYVTKIADEKFGDLARQVTQLEAQLAERDARIQADAATIARMREAIEAYCKAYDGVTGTIHVNKLMRAALKGGDHG